MLLLRGVHLLFRLLPALLQQLLQQLQLLLQLPHALLQRAHRLLCEFARASSTTGHVPLKKLTLLMECEHLSRQYLNSPLCAL